MNMRVTHFARKIKKVGQIRNPHFRAHSLRFVRTVRGKPLVLIRNIHLLITVVGKEGFPSFPLDSPVSFLPLLTPMGRGGR